MTTTETVDNAVLCGCALLTEVGPTAPIRILRISGEIDRQTEYLVHSALDAAVFGTVDEPTTYLLIDFSGVTFCSVRGLSLLHEASAAGLACGLHYELCGLSANLTRIAIILWPDGSGLRQHTLADAISALRAEQTRRPAPVRHGDQLATSAVIGLRGAVA